MRSIFLRIYIAMLCVVLAIGSGIFAGYQYWKARKLDSFLQASSQGTLRLVAEGISRHEGERQEQWLALSRRVTALPLELVQQNDAEAVPTDPVRKANGQREFQTVIPGKDGQYLHSAVQLSDINHQLLRGTQLLLLNELGRYSIDRRRQALRRLKPLFPYPLHWLSKDELAVDYLQQRALERGDTVVDFTTDADGNRQMRSIAPIGNSGDYLQLGPMALFNPLPRPLVAGTGMVTLALLILTGFLLVRPLERRLAQMALEVDQLEPGNDSRQITITGNDALTGLAHKINTMSTRIYQLLKAQRELNRAVSHELKTPLARLRFRRELALQKLLQLDGVDTSPVAQHLEGMDSSLQELNHLVEEILLYARLESTAPTLELQLLSLNPLVDSLLSALQDQHPQLQLQNRCSDDIAVTADNWHLRRALQNLLGNACRYAGGEVRVESWQEDKQLFIAIDDDGPGIDSSLHSRVLEPFYRVESSRNRQSGGTGLGLAIVSQIAQWHGGRLSIEHAALGGTRALLQLPLSQASQPLAVTN